MAQSIVSGCPSGQLVELVSDPYSLAVRAFLLAIAGVVIFLVASAYVIERGQPKWAAATVGALAFPILPAVWHVVGERKRRARIARASEGAKPDKQSAAKPDVLSAADRFVLRVVGSALLVIGPMLAVGRLDVVRAAWHHRGWFIPETPFDRDAAASALLAHVPSDADVLVVIAGDEDGQPGVGVMAYSSHQLAMLTSPASDHLEDDVRRANDQRGKVSEWLPFDELVAVDSHSQWSAMVSKRWQSAVDSGGSGPRATLRAALSRAPSDAKIVVAYAPPVPRDGIKQGVWWMLQVGVNQPLTVGGMIDAIDAKHAAESADLSALMRRFRGTMPAGCREPVDAVAQAVRVTQVGATVSWTVVIQPEQLFGLMTCAMSN